MLCPKSSGGAHSFCPQVEQKKSTLSSLVMLELHHNREVFVKLPPQVALKPSDGEELARQTDNGTV